MFNMFNTFYKYLSIPIWTIYILLFVLTYPIKYISYPILFILILYQYPFWNWIWNKRIGFWSRQPIHSDKYGLIKPPSNISIDLTLPENKIWWVFSDNLGEIEMMRKFLEINYEKDLVITEKYLRWLINNQNYSFFGILDSNKNLIGLIGASWTSLLIGDEILSGYYVDLLCVSKQHRKSGYAIKLIERVIDSWKQNKGDINLFKLENIKIDPESDFQFNYYLLDKSNISTHNHLYDVGKDSQLKILDDTNMEVAYNYFQKELVEKYQIREVYTLEKFQKLVRGDVGMSYLGYQNGKIIGFVNMLKNKYRLSEDMVEALDIVYIMGNKLEMMKHLLDLKYRYYLMMDVGGHQDLIKIYGMEKLYESKYYFYNYELLHKYKKEDMGISRF
jgi:hypothetical protein